MRVVKVRLPFLPLRHHPTGAVPRAFPLMGVKLVIPSFRGLAFFQGGELHILPRRNFLHLTLPPVRPGVKAKHKRKDFNHTASWINFITAVRNAAASVVH